MARRNATRKRSSTSWLRSRYQFGASRPSAMASGWRSTTLRAIRRIEDLPFGLLPRNRLHRPGANLFEATLGLSGPGCVGAFVGGLVLDTLKQGFGEIDSRVLGQRQRFL